MRRKVMHSPSAFCPRPRLIKAQFHESKDHSRKPRFSSCHISSCHRSVFRITDRHTLVTQVLDSASRVLVRSISVPAAMNLRTGILVALLLHLAECENDQPKHWSTSLLLVMGEQKCGTSYLHSLLAMHLTRHPQPGRQKGASLLEPQDQGSLQQLCENVQSVFRQHARPPTTSTPQ